MDEQKLKNIVEAALLAAGEPLSLDRLLGLFPEDQHPERDALRQALAALDEECASRGIELKEVGSGFRFQVRSELADWVGKLWEERPPRYSRALLETLALIAYRQPITRAEIEEIRGVTVSTHIMKTLQEREWVRVVGHRDVPGKPAMYATTRDFLDYFNLKSLDELPTLAEIRDIDRLNEEFDLMGPGGEAQSSGQDSADQADTGESSARAEAADAEAGGLAPVAMAEAEAQPEGEAPGEASGHDAEPEAAADTPAPERDARARAAEPGDSRPDDDGQSDSDDLSDEPPLSAER